MQPQPSSPGAGGLPDYEDLPVQSGAPPGSAWGVWGPDDVLGCLNLAGPSQVCDASTHIKRGTVFPLNLELDVLTEPMFRRTRHDHVVHDTVFGHEDELRGWNPQTSSQWDGFRHVKHPVYGYYNGLADERHGVHHWARRGLVARGVLADVATWRRAAGRPIRPDIADPITAEDIRATLDAQGTGVRLGDVLLIRTGWLTWYRSLDVAGRIEAAGDGVPDQCGLQPGHDTARLLWNLHVSAVATDNPGFEVMPPGASLTEEDHQAALADPERTPEYFVHTSLLPLLGLPIGELFDLDDLAADCAEDGRYTFFLSSAPLNVTGGVATPPNALAVK